MAAGDGFVSVVAFEHRCGSDTASDDGSVDADADVVGDDSSESGAGAMAKA